MVEPLDLNDSNLPDPPLAWSTPWHGNHWFRRAIDSAAWDNVTEWFGNRWAHLVWTATGFHDPRHLWRGVRPLGEGGFGYVILYEHQDLDTGVIDDRIVVKDSVHPGNNYMGQVAGIPVPNEAILMDQLSLLHRPNILLLRSFKAYWRPFVGGIWRRRFRFYLEFCEHGDLRKLRARYQHFAQFLPEMFIWHVFIGLAEAAATFRSGHKLGDAPTHRSRLRNVVDQRRGQLVHFDLKASNLLLHDPIPGTTSRWDALKDFPTVKVSDFGISQVTQSDDPDNPTEYSTCTENMGPPEHSWLHGGNGDIKEWWPTPARPPWLDDKGRAGKFLEKHNTFGIGQTIWSLITHRVFDLNTVYGDGRRIYPDGHFMGPIITWRGPVPKLGKKTSKKEEREYSEPLRSLVRRCLHPNPRERPTADELLRLVNQGLTSLVTDEGDSHLLDKRGVKRKRRDNPHRLYYRSNDINDMPPGRLFDLLFKKGDKDTGADQEGWITEAHTLQSATEAERNLHELASIPYAPIVYPKLRWNPEKEECWLMRKEGEYRASKRTRRTRYSRKSRLPPPYDVWERVDGMKRRISLGFVRADREKDVWVFGREEYGPFDHEKQEVEEARATDRREV